MGMRPLHLLVVLLGLALLLMAIYRVRDLALSTAVGSLGIVLMLVGNFLNLRSRR